MYDSRKSAAPLRFRLHEMDAYERVLGGAMAGDSTLFAREDYIEQGLTNHLAARSLKLQLGLEPKMMKKLQATLNIFHQSHFV